MVDTVYSGYTEEQWYAAPRETRLETVKKIRESSGYGPAAGEKTGSYRSDIASKIGENHDFWVGLLTGVLNLIILIGVLASLIVGALIMGEFSVFLGLIVMVLGILVTLLSVAGMKVFLRLAVDVRAIKNYLKRT